MSKQLTDLLTDCVQSTPPDQTFSLYVRGSRKDDWRDLLGYCQPGKTRVMFNEDDVIRFHVGAMQQAMKDAKCDFKGRPIGQSQINANWLMTPCEYPEKFLYMRGPTDSAMSRRRQDDNFQQFREFEQVYPA